MASRGRGGGRGPPRQSPEEEPGWDEGGEGWYAPPPPFYHHPPPMGPMPPLLPHPHPGPYGYYPNHPPIRPPFNPQNQGQFIKGQGNRQGPRGGAPQGNRGGRQPGGQAAQRGGAPQQRQGAPNATGGRTEEGKSGGGKSAQVICYNCGVPGHFSSNCTKPRVCFICFEGDHQAELCPTWGEEHQAVQCLGTASKGLSFFHIDVNHTEDRFKLWSEFDNCGIFTIEVGELDQDSLLKHLKELVDKDWPWQLIKMDDVSYMARFPPHKKVESVVINKATYFYLDNEKIMVSLKVWDGNVQPVGSLPEVWVQVVGIPPKWCDWKTLWQVASTVGKLVKVDWQSLFASFFSMVRIQVKCRDPTKIPMKRMVEMKDELFVINFIAEGVTQIEESDDKGGEDDDGTPQDVGPLNGDTNGKTPDQPDKTPENSKNQRMDKGPSIASGRSKSVRNLIVEDDDDESLLLPNDWVYDCTRIDVQPDQKEVSEFVIPEAVEQGKRTRAAEVTGGPVIPEKRTKRSPHDGKKTMGKAQALKRRNNLEMPPGYSFEGFEASVKLEPA